MAGVERGDEVWVSDLTFIASANAAYQCGARITLVDSEADSWNLDPDVVVGELDRRAAAGEPQPAAIVPVHLLGHPAQLAPILEAASRYGVTVVEDAAEALGSTWTEGRSPGGLPGSVGDFGIYSFNFNKLISTGGGGMVVARDPRRTWHACATSARRRRSRARTTSTTRWGSTTACRTSPPRSVRRRSRAWTTSSPAGGRSPSGTGMRSRRSGSRAARTQPWARRSGWLSSVVLPDPETRAAVRSALDAVSIEARPIWPPLRTQAPYRDAPVLGGTTAVSIADRVLCLPCAAHLTTEQQDEVIDRVLAVLRSG